MSGLQEYLHMLYSQEHRNLPGSKFPEPSKGQNVTVLPKPEALRPDAARALVKPSDISDEYAALARELGYVPQALKDRQAETEYAAVIETCLDNGFPIYPIHAVESYMTKLATELGVTWYWSRLTSRNDAQLHSRIEKLPWKFRIVFDTYTKPVPVEMLRRAAILNRAHPRNLIFVTDYAAKNPDPFICMLVGDRKPVVFGVWDEPGFSVTK